MVGVAGGDRGEHTSESINSIIDCKMVPAVVSHIVVTLHSSIGGGDFSLYPAIHPTLTRRPRTRGLTTPNRPGP